MNPEPRLLTADTASGASQFQGRISMMEQRKLQLGPGKYSGNKGIDAIYFNIDNPSQLTILESKWRGKLDLGIERFPSLEQFLGRGIKNPAGPGYLRQMSPEWIREVRNRLLQSTDPARHSMGLILRRYGTTANRYINVLNVRGETVLRVMQ